MFKDNLIHTRKLLGMTQEDIAEKLGVTGQTVAKWESGDEGQGLDLIKQEAFLAMAEEKKLLLTEAIWTRYMPSRKLIEDVVKSGKLGKIVTVDSNLGYKINMNERMVKPELAGGCLLDLTVYTLNFSSMILGNDIKRISASFVPTDTGVDGQDSVMLEYSDGTMASMFTTMYGLTDRRGLICGTEGFMCVRNINNPEKITIYEPDRTQYRIKEDIPVPEQITGYEYEVLACKKALEEGRIECEEMPHSETLTIMRQMDEIRRQYGIVLSFIINLHIQQVFGSGDNK